MSKPVPRVTSRTQLHESPLPMHQRTMSMTSTTVSLPSAFLAFFHPRKSRYRTTLLALLALVLLSTYIFFVAAPALALTPLALRRTESNVPRRPTGPEADKQALLAIAAAKRRKWSAANTNRAQIQLDPAQELAAVTSFLASLPQNVIPSSIDPSRSIDPQLVLDFDTRSSRAAEEVNAMVEDAWSRNPVVLYSKVRSYRPRC